MGDQKFSAIGGPAYEDRFKLTLGPDGIYRVDGRVIPAADHPAYRVDNGKPVIGVHGGVDNLKSPMGAVIGMNVPKG